MRRGGGLGNNLPLSDPVFLGVLNTRIEGVENSESVFDPDFHTEIIIKDEHEDFNSSNMKFFL